MTTIELDGKGKVLGRLASQIAITLQGKNTATYRRDRLADVKVVVHNADQVVVTGKKEKQKMYYHFSGYPGGLSKTNYERVKVTKPDMILKQAVKRMLPDNRSRRILMDRLTIEIGKK